MTGEAIYLDDLPKIVGELYLSFVLSTKAHAKILKVDPSQALSLKGVVAFYDANDVPEHENYVGPVLHDEEMFVSKKVRDPRYLNTCKSNSFFFLHKIEFYR